MPYLLKLFVSLILSNVPFFWLMTVYIFYAQPDGLNKPGITEQPTMQPTMQPTEKPIDRSNRYKEPVNAYPDRLKRS